MSRPSMWCLCQGKHSNCRGWQEYVAQHKRLHGQEPTDLDVLTDRIVMSAEVERDVAELACELKGDHIWHTPELEPHALDQVAADQCRRCGCVRHDTAPPGHPDTVPLDARVEEIFAEIATAMSGISGEAEPS